MVYSIGQNRNRLASEGNGKSYATRINEKKRRLSELRRHTRQMSADMNVQDNRCGGELQGQYVTNLEDKEILLNKHRERLNSDRSSDKPLWLPPSADVASFARSISELNDSSSLSDQFDFLQKFSPKLKAEGYRPFDGSKIAQLQPRALDGDAAPFFPEKDASEVKMKQSGKNRDFQFAGVDNRGSLEHIPEDRALEPQPRKKLGAIGKMNSDASLGSYSSVFSDGTLSSDTQNASDLTSLDSDFSDDSFKRNSLPKDLRLGTKMTAAESTNSREGDSLKSDSSALTFTGNSLTEKNEQDELLETPTHKEIIEDTDCFKDETPTSPSLYTDIQPASIHEPEAPTVISDGLYRPAEGNRNHKTKSVSENQATNSSVRVAKISNVDSMTLVDMPVRSQTRLTRKPKKLSRTLTSGLRAASQSLLPQKRRHTVETVVAYLKMAKQDQDEVDSVQFVHKCGEASAKLSTRASFSGLEFKDSSSFPSKSPSSDTEDDRKDLSKSDRKTKSASTDDTNRRENPVLNSAKLKCTDGQKESSLSNYEDKQNEHTPSQAERSKPRASSSSSSRSSHFKTMGQSFSDPGLCDPAEKEDNTIHFTSGPKINRENLQIVALNIAAARPTSKLRKPVPEIQQRITRGVTKASQEREVKQELRVTPLSDSLPSIAPELNRVYAHRRPKSVGGLETEPMVGLQIDDPPKRHTDSSAVTQVHTTSHGVLSTESVADNRGHSSPTQKALATGSMQELPRELHGTSVPHVGGFRKVLGASSKTKEIKTVCASVNVSNIRSSFEKRPRDSA